MAQHHRSKTISWAIAKVQYLLSEQSKRLQMAPLPLSTPPSSLTVTHDYIAKIKSNLPKKKKKLFRRQGIRNENDLKELTASSCISKVRWMIFREDFPIQLNRLPQQSTLHLGRKEYFSIGTHTVHKAAPHKSSVIFLPHPTSKLLVKRDQGRNMRDRLTSAVNWSVREPKSHRLEVPTTPQLTTVAHSTH